MKNLSCIYYDVLSQSIAPKNKYLTYLFAVCTATTAMHSVRTRPLFDFSINIRFILQVFDFSRLHKVSGLSHGMSWHFLRVCFECVSIYFLTMFIISLLFYKSIAQKLQSRHVTWQKIIMSFQNLFVFCSIQTVLQNVVEHRKQVRILK